MMRHREQPDRYRDRPGRARRAHCWSWPRARRQIALRCGDRGGPHRSRQCAGRGRRWPAPGGARHEGHHLPAQPVRRTASRGPSQHRHCPSRGQRALTAQERHESQASGVGQIWRRPRAGQVHSSARWIISTTRGCSDSCETTRSQTSASPQRLGSLAPHHHANGCWSVDRATANQGGPRRAQRLGGQSARVV